MKRFGKETSIASSASFTAGSNILGATGLPRAALRGLFAQRGLFGAESALTRHEQAGIYAELQLPAGTVPGLSTTQEIADPWRIAAIRSLAREVLRPENDGFEPHAALARSFGIEDRVATEVIRTVRTAKLLYGVGVRIRQDVAVCNVAPVRDAMAQRPAALASA